MQDITKRNILFIFGCIPVRFLIALAACPKKWLYLFCIFALIPIFGWLNILVFSPRTTGPEVFGEKIWWQNYRIIHLSLWIIAAIFAAKQSRYAAVFLFVDVFIGLGLFLNNRTSK